MTGRAGAPQQRGDSGLHRPFTIAEVRPENGRCNTLVFGESLPAQPGQYVMAWLPGVDERPFSVAAAHPLALMVVAVGPCSRALHRLSVGDRVWVRGPLGQGFRPRGRQLLLVGGGYGVAPLLFLAREVVAGGGSADVCIGAQTAADVLLVDDFRRAGAGVSLTTEDGSLGRQGLVSEAVRAAVSSKRPDLVCACGPAGMLEAVDRQCAAHDLPCQLSWEACLRCGMGLCGNCELPPLQSGDEQVRGSARPGPGWLVCRDGPVSFSR
jgi:dihydroorotate dehydrogenase electron transfer subunit